MLHIRLLAPESSSHLRSLRPVAALAVHLHSSCRIVWHLQTAQRVNRSQTYLRSKFQSTCIGFCLPIAVLQCDPETQRSSNAHLGVPTQLWCGAHVHTGLGDTYAERQPYIISPNQPYIISPNQPQSAPYNIISPNQPQSAPYNPL